jgi:hypothetical protein
MATSSPRDSRPCPADSRPADIGAVRHARHAWRDGRTATVDMRQLCANSRSGSSRSRCCCGAQSAGGASSGEPAGSGTRGAEALALVKAQPGITISELAEKMGIKQNYLYRVLPGLAADGLVVKDGRGWKPKDTA